MQWLSNIFSPRSKLQRLRDLEGKSESEKVPYTDEGGRVLLRELVEDCCSQDEEVRHSAYDGGLVLISKSAAVVKALATTKPLLQLVQDALLDPVYPITQRPDYDSAVSQGYDSDDEDTNLDNITAAALRLLAGLSVHPLTCESLCEIDDVVTVLAESFVAARMSPRSSHVGNLRGLCLCVGNLAGHGPSRAQFLATPQLLHALRESLCYNDAYIVRYAALAFANMSSRGLQPQLCQPVVLSALVNVLLSIGDREAVVYCAAAIANLAVDDVARRHLQSVGAIHVTTSALYRSREGSDSPQLARAVAALCYGYDATSQAATQSNSHLPHGSPTAVVDALLSLLDSADEECRLHAITGLNNFAVCPHNQQILINAHVMEKVIKHLRRNSSNSSPLAQHLMTILVTMSSHEPERPWPVDKLVSLLTDLYSGEQEERLRVGITSVIANLSLDSRCVDSLLDNAVLSILISQLTPEANPQILEAVLSSIVNLSADPTHISVLAARGSLWPILSVLFGTSVLEVQLLCARALGNLTNGSKVQALLLHPAPELGPRVDIIVNGEPQDPSALDIVMIMLLDLAESQSDHQIPVMEFLTTAVANAVARESVACVLSLSVSAQTLVQLAASGPSNKVQAEAVRCLRNILIHEDCREPLLVVGVFDALAFQACSQVPEIRSRACDALTLVRPSVPLAGQDVFDPIMRLLSQRDPDDTYSAFSELSKAILYAESVTRTQEEEATATEEAAEGAEWRVDLLKAEHERDVREWSLTQERVLELLTQTHNQIAASGTTRDASNEEVPGDLDSMATAVHSGMTRLIFEIASQRTRLDATEAQLAEAESKVFELESDAVLKQHSGERYEDMESDLRAQLSQANDNLAKARTEKDKLLSQKTTLDNKLKNAEARAAKEQKEKDKFLSQKKALDTKLKNAEARAREQEKSATQSESEIESDLRSKLSDAEARVRAEVSNLEQVTAKLKAAEERLQAETAKHAEETSTLQTKVESSEARLAEEVEKRTEVEETLSDKVRETEELVTLEAQKKDEISNTLAELRLDYADLERQLEDSERSREELADAQTAGADPTELETRASQASDDLAKARSEIETLLSDLEEERLSLATLVKAKREVDERVAGVEEERDEAIAARDRSDTEVTQLRVTLSNTEAQLAEASSALNDLRTETGLTTATKEKLTEELVESNEKIKLLEAELNAAQSEAVDTATELARERELVSSMTESQRASDERIADLETKLESTSDQLAVRTKFAEQAAQQLKLTTRHLSEKLKSQAVDGATASTAAGVVAQESYEHIRSALAAKTAALKDSEEQARLQADTAAGELRTANERIFALTSDLDARDVEIEQLKLRSDHTQSRVQELDRLVSGLEVSKSSLEDQNEKQESELASRASEITRLQNQVTHLQDEVQTLQAQRDSLQSELSALPAGQSTSDLQMTIKSLEQKIDDKERANDQLRTMLTTVETEATRKGARIDELQLRLETEEAQHSRLKVEHNAMSVTASGLKSQLEVTEIKLSDSIRDASELRQQRDAVITASGESIAPEVRKALKAEIRAEIELENELDRAVSPDGKGRASSRRPPAHQGPSPADKARLTADAHARTVKAHKEQISSLVEHTQDLYNQILADTDVIERYHIALSERQLDLDRHVTDQSKLIGLAQSVVEHARIAGSEDVRAASKTEAELLDGMEGERDEQGIEYDKISEVLMRLRTERIVRDERWQQHSARLKKLLHASNANLHASEDIAALEFLRGRLERIDDFEAKLSNFGSRLAQEKSSLVHLQKELTPIGPKWSTPTQRRGTPSAAPRSSARSNHSYLTRLALDDSSSSNSSFRPSPPLKVPDVGVIRTPVRVAADALARYGATPEDVGAGIAKAGEAAVSPSRNWQDRIDRSVDALRERLGHSPPREQAAAYTTAIPTDPTSKGRPLAPRPSDGQSSPADAQLSAKPPVGMVTPDVSIHRKEQHLDMSTPTTRGSPYTRLDAEGRLLSPFNQQPSPPGSVRSRARVAQLAAIERRLGEFSSDLRDLSKKLT